MVVKVEEARVAVRAAAERVVVAGAPNRAAREEATVEGAMAVARVVEKAEVAMVAGARGVVGKGAVTAEAVRVAAAMVVVQAVAVLRVDSLAERAKEAVWEELVVLLVAAARSQPVAQEGAVEVPVAVGSCRLGEDVARPRSPNGRHPGQYPGSYHAQIAKCRPWC